LGCGGCAVPQEIFTRSFVGGWPGARCSARSVGFVSFGGDGVAVRKRSAVSRRGSRTSTGTCALFAPWLALDCMNCNGRVYGLSCGVSIMRVQHCAHCKRGYTSTRTATSRAICVFTHEHTTFTLRANTRTHTHTHVHNTRTRTHTHTHTHPHPHPHPHTHTTHVTPGCAQRCEPTTDAESYATTACDT
jgi:hypothetical protein